MSISNDQMNVDAKLKFTEWQKQDVSEADSVNKLPLFCDSLHDAWVLGIETVVCKPGGDTAPDTTDDVVVNVGSIADPDLIGSFTVDGDTTPAINAVVAGTLNSATKSTVYESHGAVFVPKGTPIYATYTADSDNVAERACRLSYFLSDETTFD